MGKGNNITEGQKGKNFPYQFNVLRLLGQINQGITGGVPAPSGLATETTLQSVLTAVDSMRDYEVRLVVDSAPSPVTWLEVRYWDAQTGALGAPQYYLPGSTTPGTPTGGTSYINPNTFLAQLVAELQALNAVDFATEATQAAIETLLTTINTAITTNIDAPLSTLATETTLAAVETLLTSIDGKDFATEATLAALNAKFNTLGQKASALSAPVVLSTEQEALLGDIEAAITALASSGLVTEATLSALNGKFNSLSQKASAASHPVVLSTEQETILSDIEAAITALSSSGLATEATLAALETYVTARELSQERKFNIVRDTVTGTIYIRVDSINDQGVAALSYLDENFGSVAPPTNPVEPYTPGTDELNASLALLLGVDYATEATSTTIASNIAATNVLLTSLDGKLNTLGQKASAASAPVVLSTEQEVILDAIKTAVENIDSDLGTGGLATETTLQAIETLVTSTNALLTTIDADTSNLDVLLSTRASEATLQATNVLLTTIDGVLDAIKVDTGALVVDVAAIEVLITTTNSLLTTIDAVLDSIKVDTAAMVVDLAAIETELLDQGTTLDSIDTRLAGSQRGLSVVRATTNGSTTAGVQSVSLTFLGTNGTLDGDAVPNGFSIAFSPNKGEDTVGAIAYTVPTGGDGVVLIGYVL